MLLTAPLPPAAGDVKDDCLATGLEVVGLLDTGVTAGMLTLPVLDTKDWRETLLPAMLVSLTSGVSDCCLDTGLTLSAGTWALPILDTEGCRETALLAMLVSLASGLTGATPSGCCLATAWVAGMLTLPAAGVSECCLDTGLEEGALVKDCCLDTI